MEVAEYIGQGQAVVLEYAREGIKESRNAFAKEARGDSLSVVLDDAGGLKLDNGDAVVVAIESGGMTVYLDARVIGMVAKGSLNMRITGKRECKEGSGFAVYDSIPFEYLKVPQEEYKRYKGSYRSLSEENLSTDIWQREDSINKDGIEPELYNCLIDIERKLSLIIRHLSSHGKGETVIPEEKKVEISASEIRFDAGEEFSPGDILKIRMILSTYPITFVNFLSEVKKVVPLGDGRYETFVTYSGLNNEVKDRIIAYLFKRQREVIRNERG